MVAYARLPAPVSGFLYQSYRFSGRLVIFISCGGERQMACDDPVSAAGRRATIWYLVQEILGIFLRAIAILLGN